MTKLESPLDGMTRGEYERYQNELNRILDGSKVRSDKGKKREKRNDHAMEEAAGRSQYGAVAGH